MTSQSRLNLHAAGRNPAAHTSMKQVPVLLLLCLLAISCKKSDDNTETSTANFIITGLKDIDLTLTSNGTISIPISVVPSGGTKDTVELFGDQFPSGLYANFQPRTGVTPFTS